MQAGHMASEFNYASVPEDVVKRARAAVAKLDSTMIHIARKSNHPDDNYLFVVVGRMRKAPNAFSVWTLNTSIFGLEQGHYMLTYPNAMRIYAGLLHDCYQ